ncbi:flagella basal body P-ring formation protein FlgA [Herbaspirillum sp. Sphag1AN]|uniref:flagellar basal body P-ring formation chaperone FlgA n=1 Tax=unclassified Herbaspirillum TaxID=2624150 RepID=UPI00160FBB98|nr:MULTISPECIES: flagellar basal body P-ring formation chaperone FlgA [unclassified Herbaspirillum]MBB3211036.1 flagella basal body P-ring formation protein FlgA [Herbaspirillum sp. Sphag1AN]MBB3244665.1 flagella basal body P-ring formation protein FlgA [Herbaspirillum sp. Sphag64]
MKFYSTASALLFMCVFASSVTAQSTAQQFQSQSPAQQRQDLVALQQVAEQFMQTQTNGIPGTITVTTEPLNPALNLQACPTPQAFMPNGGRLWGKTTVGIRCTAPSQWTVYMRATVQVMSPYIVAAAPLAQGQTINPTNIAVVTGDLGSLPNGVITDESQAIGRVANMSIPAGAPIRQDALRANRVVQQGQAVRIVSIGQGFQITTEGRALNNAGEGELVQAKTVSGQVISGVAKAGGIVEIRY